MGRTNETKSVNNTNNKSMLIIAFGIIKKKCKILGFVASWLFGSPSNIDVLHIANPKV